MSKFIKLFQVTDRALTKFRLFAIWPTTKLLLPRMPNELVRSSLLRYEMTAYNKDKFNFIYNLLYLVGFLAVGPFMVAKVSLRSKKTNQRVLFDVNSQEFFDEHCGILKQELNHIDVAYCGRGTTIGPIDSAKFVLFDALWVFTFSVLLFPYILLFGLLSPKFFGRALFKTVVIYYRTRHFFEVNQCKTLVTLQDNIVSAAFYAAFKGKSGKHLIAIQNGVRFSTEGIGYSYFDHLLAINRSAVEVYRSCGSVINRFTAVAPLPLDNFLRHKVDDTTYDWDLIFIDQGYPGKLPNLWAPNYGEDLMFNWFAMISQFCQRNTQLKIGYLMRRYSGHQLIISTALQQWSSNLPIDLIQPTSANETYSAIRRAGCVITVDSTLGLEALALSKKVLFFNLTDNPQLDVCAPPLQFRNPSFLEFEKALVRICQNSSPPTPKLLRRYAPPSTLGAIGSLKNLLAELD